MILGIKGHFLFFFVSNSREFIIDQVSGWGRKGDITQAKRFLDHGNYLEKF